MPGIFDVTHAKSSLKLESTMSMFGRRSGLPGPNWESRSKSWWYRKWTRRSTERWTRRWKGGRWRGGQRGGQWGGRGGGEGPWMPLGCQAFSAPLCKYACHADNPGPSPWSLACHAFLAYQSPLYKYAWHPKVCLDLNCAYSAIMAGMHIAALGS